MRKKEDLLLPLGILLGKDKNTDRHMANSALP